ncbi:hypothetical protein BDN70DRAFT_209764 [Pholiota conissans]|uniref:Uncharacterized protein n=1 Tax=Pholiota conissans TaxID=109636 RepID=A0A9P5YW64_9AGAR|nr:hypothetical protein BDN70DRAFT_209764 [Pholiota conissans]
MTLVLVSYFQYEIISIDASNWFLVRLVSLSPIHPTSATTEARPPHSSDSSVGAPAASPKSVLCSQHSDVRFSVSTSLDYVRHENTSRHTCPVRDTCMMAPIFD